MNLNLSFKAIVAIVVLFFTGLGGNEFLHHGLTGS